MTTTRTRRTVKGSPIAALFALILVGGIIWGVIASATTAHHAVHGQLTAACADTGVVAGMEVTVEVTGPDATPAPSGTLGEAVPVSDGTCMYPFTVQVPDSAGDSYHVHLPLQPGPTYTHDMMVTNGWEVWISA